MNRDDFLLLNSGVIYFDNAATTLKPKCVVDSLNDYYVKECDKSSVTFQRKQTEIGPQRPVKPNAGGLCCI